MTDDKPQLHQSHISMMERCGEQFRRRYVLNEIRPPAVAMVAGSAVHKGAEVTCKTKLETGELPPVGMVVDATRDELRRLWEAGVELNEDERALGESAVEAKTVDLTVSAASTYHTQFAPLIEPTHVERRFVLELDGYPYDFAGRMDVQTAQSVRDLKLTGRKRDPDKSLQLTAYAMAVHTLDGFIPDVTYDLILKYKSGLKAQSISSERTPAHFEAFLRRIEAIITAMQKGVFVPANPDDWCCSPKWCGYHHDCPYVRGRRVIAMKAN
jgi:hypothetical protein